MSKCKGKSKSKRNGKGKRKRNIVIRHLIEGGLLTLLLFFPLQSLSSQPVSDKNKLSGQSEQSRQSEQSEQSRQSRQSRQSEQNAKPGTEQAHTVSHKKNLVAEGKLPLHLDAFVFREKILANLNMEKAKNNLLAAYTFSSNRNEYTRRPELSGEARTKAVAALKKSGYFEQTEPMTHHMMLLVIQLGIIIFAAKFGGLVFERYLKMPAVLGELSAGILIGPHVLGSIALPGFAHGLFHTIGSFPVSTELYGIATVASIILLFLAGLETDLSMFLRFSLTGSMVGIGGVLASFLVGDLTAVLLSGMVSDTPLTFMHPIALFLGTISTATSVGITARVLSERRKMDSPEGVSILAGAVIDDVLGIIILAIVLGIASVHSSSGIAWSRIGLIAGKAFGFWLGATVLGLLLARKISSFLKGFGPGVMASMALGLALLLAGLSEMAGLAMIIGAYIMGLSLSKTDIAHELEEKLSPLYHFFVPVFFTVMGMLVDFSAFTSTSIIIFGIIYSVLAVISKLLGSSLPSLLLGFNWRGALRIGLGMVPRGEVALIVAGIGLSAGIIPASVFGISVMMTLLTTVLAPPALVAAFKSPKRGTREEISTRGREVRELSLQFQSEQTTNMVLERLLRTFRDEEFFVHLVDIEGSIYSVRKNEIMLSIHCKPEELILDVHERDTQYIKFILSETIINLMETLQEVQEASDLQDKPRELLSS